MMNAPPNKFPPILCYDVLTIFGGRGLVKNHLADSQEWYCMSILLMSTAIFYILYVECPGATQVHYGKTTVLKLSCNMYHVSCTPRTLSVYRFMPSYFCHAHICLAGEKKYYFTRSIAKPRAVLRRGSIQNHTPILHLIYDRTCQVLSFQILCISCFLYVICGSPT